MADTTELRLLEVMLRKWGRERRRILTGQRVFGDGWVHVDGWPTVSVADRLRDGGITGGSGTATQHFAEVYSEDVLPTWRAVRELGEENQLVLNLHYALPGPAPAKWACFDSKAAYYWRLARAKAAMVVSLWPSDALTC